MSYSNRWKAREGWIVLLLQIGAYKFLVNCGQRQFSFFFIAKQECLLQLQSIVACFTDDGCEGWTLIFDDA